MNTKETLALVLLTLNSAAFASGFGLYEPSALSTAMGGALVGKAMDASANFNNPATLTDLKDGVVTLGFVTEHPRGTVDVNGREYDMDPGPFMLPHFQFATPLPADFAFGLGISPEYGLGTAFDDTWAMNWNTLETTVESMVVNPNLAYRITDDWSVGAGIRWLYFSFEQNAYPNAGKYGRLNHELKGDNGFKDFGWQIGTKYDILDNLSVGLVYKAPIKVTVEGDSDARVRSYDYSSIASLNGTPYYAAAQQQIRQGVDAAARKVYGDAEADLTLPQSITGGINWDVTDDWHLGTSVSWTEWSKIDTLHFILNGNDNPKNLSWHDTWRASFGVAYDITDDWTAMLSYIFDMDCTDKEQSSAMLPPADRHILGGGLTWRCWRGLEFSLCYSCVFMDGGEMTTADKNGTGQTYHLSTQEGFCHAGGFGVTYRF